MLFHTVGKSSVDDILSQIIQQYESAFPSRIRGYYLLGSYVDARAVVGSDIDMYILFQEQFLSKDEADQAKQLVRSCQTISHVRLDMKIADEQSLVDDSSIMRVGLKRNSVLLYGEDTRAAMALPTVDIYKRDVTDAVLEFLFRLRPLTVITYPLDYPDPNGFFYGYDHLERLRHDDTSVFYATRELVECATRIATALLVLKTESFVGTKRESVEVYRDKIGDVWSPFLIAMFEKGKMLWKYGLPERVEERAELRTLCEQMLAFENYYLLHYRTYLLVLLQSGNDHATQFAQQRLKTVLYKDESGITGV